VAIGATESKGLRKGLIVNLDATVSSIRRAVEEAEALREFRLSPQFWELQAAT